MSDVYVNVSSDILLTLPLAFVTYSVWRDVNVYMSGVHDKH